VIVFKDVIPHCAIQTILRKRIKEMNTVNVGQNISTPRSIVQLGLPSRQQHKALELLALAEALISPFFAAPEIKSVAKKAPAIKPVLKAQ
jgi:hypothetical protein